MPETTEENKQTLLEALAAFQQELVKVQKTADNPFHKSKYAKLEDIMEVVQPVLFQHNLYLTQWPVETPCGAPGLKTVLFHTESGQRIEETTPLILVKQDPQAQGSALTYMKRYSIAAILQIIIDEDDDGNAAVASTPAPATPSYQTTTAQAPAPTLPIAEAAEGQASQAELKRLVQKKNKVFPDWQSPEAKSFYFWMKEQGWDFGKYNGDSKTRYNFDLPEEAIAKIDAELDRLEEPF